MFRDQSIIFRFNGLLGVPVEIGQSMIFLALLVVGFTANSGAIIWGLTIFAMLITSIYLHELGHAWGAKVQGIPVRRIVLSGLGGYCEQTRSASAHQSELIVAMGPIVNLALWAISSLIAAYLLASARIEIDPISGIAIVQNDWVFPVIGYLSLFARFNFWLAMFNLIPAQPLDGGKLFHLGLLRYLPGATAMRIAGAVGLVFSLLWIPGMILLYLTLGWVLFFMPSIREHWKMWRG
jgi:Zn-dependent protease